MRLKTQIQHRQRGRNALITAANQARRNTWTQDQYLTAREAVIASLPEYPRTIRQYVREFGAGYWEAIMHNWVVCLYCDNGKLYRLTNEDRAELVHLPTWESLPRAQWSGMRSGLYWINGGKPVLMFKGSH